MADYRRPFVPGGMFFLTIVTHDRRAMLLEPNARAALRRAIDETRESLPFDLIAIVVLPDHLHLMLELPTGEADVSSRVGSIKALFTKTYLATGGIESTQSDSRTTHRHRGVWQRRFHDHAIRDDRDFQEHLDYLVYNPVHHGLCKCPHDWPHSSFHRLVKQGVYERDWSCSCNGERRTSPRAPTHLRFD